MWESLEADIIIAAKVRIRRHERYAQWVSDENKRRARRENGATGAVLLKTPSLWERGSAFNPYKVHSSAGRLASGIRSAIVERRYKPLSPEIIKLDKPGGGSRALSVLSIADEAVSRRLMKSLLRRNQASFNGRSYAYREDRGPHDAVEYVAKSWSGTNRIFVAQYDFSKFFDKVSHKYLLHALDEHGIRRTRLEQYLIQEFLRIPVYDEREEKLLDRASGLPQGTSISLFLANVAATELDNLLERRALNFARYADDTVIWSESYDEISRAADILHHFASKAGTPINLEKSPGIQLLVQSSRSATEFTSIQSTDYLGHTISSSGVSISDARVREIKRRIRQLIYSNLLRAPLRGRQDMGRITANDRDYVAYIWQVRRYLYGGLSERDLRRYHGGYVPPRSFKGLMAFYPSVDNYQQLRALDGWMLNQTILALKRRADILGLSGVLPSPHGLAGDKLLKLEVPSSRTGNPIDLRFPSFLRMARVIRSAVEANGFDVLSGRPDVYNYSAELIG
ncbi:hypothetical protein CFK38_02000 [Brachybacterium vulturis]|uniref:Reverse transcriptase domain-containing protein n=1 Tax=Brachybacterium vulturis TaxID=2017484 RepID=A0A291GK47_9MICO|nr:reverse transcriptase domain-containing protein [Brachybacterium vulturis]ATG50432.1 hypothetical protein CFK38_02000 [Brachybacterium vulturis]